MIFTVFYFISTNSNSQFNEDAVILPNVRKEKDIVIYQDPKFYSSFPSIIKTASNEFIVAFRRAPDRRIFGENGNSHVDPNSYLMLVRSKDGENWSEKAELIYAHPFGGSQDPCLLKLTDGTILCTSYGWAFVNTAKASENNWPVIKANGATFLGGYIVKSIDEGETWDGPIFPPSISNEVNLNAIGEPLPSYNRGGLYEKDDGSILWIVAVNDTIPIKKTSNHLLVSINKGIDWDYVGLVASDEIISFNEASIYETPKKDLVAFIRTGNFGDHACIARSKDGGKTFSWESMGFQGHPINALKLPDKRVLLTYGYRHKPFGIRARILNEECTDYKTAPEIVLRDDGGNSDIGYTWPVLLNDNRVLVVYYFNKDNGTRYIAGTILHIK